MLVEFQRVAMAQPQQPEGYGGEDDGLPAIEANPLPLAINPLLVAAVTPSGERPDVTIIKLADGRGYAVRGAYRAIMDQLEAGGSAARQPH